MKENTISFGVMMSAPCVRANVFNCLYGLVPPVKPGKDSITFVALFAICITMIINDKQREYVIKCSANDRVGV